MPDARFKAWGEFFLDKEGYNRLNKNADVILNVSKLSADYSKEYVP